MSLNLHIAIRIAVAFAVFLVSAAGFVGVVDEVRDGDALPLDQSILRFINGFSNSALDSFFITVTALGGIVAVTIGTVLIVTLLVIRQWYYRALFVACGVGGAAIINQVLKLLFERSRPDLWRQLVTETSFSFPSGHAMASSALAASSVVVFWHTRWRIPALIVGAVYIVLVGFSRLYLGVHYPTDVLAGWFVSACWIILLAGILTARFYTARATRQQAP